MVYQLLARTGPCKGSAWTLGELPLVLGRDAACDITVPDPIVSRRHCEVGVSDGGPWVRDLGSSNATFVNAAPTKEARLAPGDEIALGGVVFMVARVEAPGETPTFDLGEEEPKPATSMLKVGEPTFLERDEADLFERGRPRTAEDLAALFGLGRSLSSAASMPELMATLLERVGERFAPVRKWVVLVEAQGDPPTVYPPDTASDFSANRALVEIVQNALETPKGIFLPERLESDGHTGICSTLVAPLALAGEAVGALVLQAETPARIYDENDLELLLAVAHTSAPYVRAIDQLEQLERENKRLVAGDAHAGPMIGTSRAVAHVRSLARKCAWTDFNVVILGETGTGKELVARLIHDLSRRGEQPLVTANCAAIPEELFESEMFGHERGAFTGAHAAKAGLFEEANEGTLFLDEVGDLSLPNQARLLRAIEAGTFRRLGGRADMHVNVRVLSATNKDLAEEVEAGRFRRDLYHRLNTFDIRIPPLRDRRGDIPMLAEHFLADAQQRMRQSGVHPPHHIEGFEPEALQALQDYPWPGNVRELRNVVERALVVGHARRVRATDLQFQGMRPQTGDQRFPTLQELEREHIRKALQLCGGSVKDAADRLGIGRSTLYRKVADYQLDN